MYLCIWLDYRVFARAPTQRKLSGGEGGDVRVAYLNVRRRLPLREYPVNIFSMRYALERQCVVLEGQTHPVVSEAHAVVRLEAF